MRKSASTAAGKGSSSGASANAKAEHRKEVMDPLHSMRGYVEAKKKCVEAVGGSTLDVRPDCVWHIRSFAAVLVALLITSPYLCADSLVWTQRETEREGERGRQG